MVAAPRIAIVAMAVAMLGSGCAPWNIVSKPGDLPLRAAKASADSVTLEIYFARLPATLVDAEDRTWSETLWRDIDEQRLSFEVRRELAAAGIRAGTVGATTPRALVELLQLNGDAITASDTLEPKTLAEEEPSVQRRVLQLRSGRRGEVLASSVLPEMVLWLHDDGKLRGETYHNAQGLLAISAELEGQNNIRLRMTPEVQHGNPKQSFAGDDGVFRIEMKKPTVVLDHLRTECELSPGEMIVMTSLPDRPGSLGHYLFREASPHGEQQKVLVIRLVHAPSSDQVRSLDDLLAADE